MLSISQAAGPRPRPRSTVTSHSRQFQGASPHVRPVDHGSVDLDWRALPGVMGQCQHPTLSTSPRKPLLSSLVAGDWGPPDHSLGPVPDTQRPPSVFHVSLANQPPSQAVCSRLRKEPKRDALCSQRPRGGSWSGGFLRGENQTALTNCSSD